MMPPWVLVNAILAVPLVGAIVVALLGPKRGSTVRQISLLTVLVNLALTVWLIVPTTGELSARPESPTAGDELTFAPLHQTRVSLLSFGADPAAIQYFVGIDGLNIWLVALTAFLMLPSILISWTAITERLNEYYAWLLLLETAMIGVFLAFDVVLFYVFFELTLVPLFFLIGIWGGPMRRDAARKFFLFTITGSLITLVGMVGLVVACRNNSELTFAVPDLVKYVQMQMNVQDPVVRSAWLSIQTWVFLALTAGFAVKVPLFPIHTWLPLAHVEAPTAGSVLLAGVLLKLGSYGFLRLAIPLCPDAALSIGVPLLGTLSCMGIVYGALCAYAQSDVKKLVAYSSVSHMAFCILGLFALNQAGVTGGLLQMINHGLSTAGLFLVVGMLYERYHTRMIADYSGIAARLRVLAAFMVFVCLSSIGFPGLNGFIGEMLILAGSYGTPAGAVWAVTIAAGIFLGSWYLFTMLKDMFYGPLHEPHHGDGPPVGDLNAREYWTLVPLAVACLALGLYPQPVIDSTQRDVNVVVKIADAARARATASTPQP